MRNPCTRDCPDRQPGCNCEKRKAWKFLHEQAKARGRKNTVDLYIQDTVQRIRRISRRQK